MKIVGSLYEQQVNGHCQNIKRNEPECDPFEYFSMEMEIKKERIKEEFRSGKYVVHPVVPDSQTGKKGTYNLYRYR
ncbi:hypothetical protein [Sediminibacterium ginsengisoli]|uniref:Uncharacterized protein n=1 Tax=Sediminibacterium ginsengisoli TaxID=413434 RepID=A0A1T4LV59_9BACT|nr:hypothetical protein [Sediminibacterium ginsengisoli]SJZ58537.1 hypothetical protein SAMN04488132_10315 [Sediminibacterium ginsengisoli]